MNSFDEKVKVGLRALSEDISSDAVARIQETINAAEAIECHSTGRRGFTRLAMTAFAGAAAATAALMLLNATGVLGGATSPPTPSANASRLAKTPPASAFNGVPVAPLGTPCDGAIRLPLVGLLSLLPAKVWLPANDVSRVTDAWSCGNVPVLMLGDVQASYEPGWSDVPVDAKLNDLAADLGGKVVKIDGLSVLVAAANELHTNNEVLLVIGDTAVKLLSRGDVSIDVLMNDARAINPLRPSN